MDLFPLYNSARIALISSAITFFIGVFAAYYVVKLPEFLRLAADMILTLPLVLPPTVVGFFILKALGVNSPIGAFFAAHDIKFIMKWYSSIFATVIVTLPLMYRAARGSFESFDYNLKYAAMTLGKSDTWIFWRVIMPGCKGGILAGAVLSFARALGEYGATSMVSGYTPGQTATISTTVYQLWRTGHDAAAYRWVLVNLAVSFAVLAALGFLQRKS